MLRNSSPKQSENFKESEENCLENTIVEYHSSRDSFHLLISNSFYSLYPDLFLDSGGLDILPTTYYSFPPQSYPFDMLNFGEINSEHNIDKTRFDACSLSSLTWEKDMLRDDLHNLLLKKTMHYILWTSNILSFMFVLCLARILMFILHILK
jgi:hypothetical protein